MDLQSLPKGADILSGYFSTIDNSLKDKTLDLNIDPKLNKTINPNILSLLPAAGNIVGNVISGGLESAAGSSISNIGGMIGGAISTFNPVIGGIVSGASSLVGGLTNKAFGSKLNDARIGSIENTIRDLNSLEIDDSSNQSILDQYDSIGMGQVFSKSDIGKDGWFSKKAKKKYNELVYRQNVAKRRALGNFANAAENVEDNAIFDALQNEYGFGGMINPFSNGGSIHIKKSNRGKFTDYCGGNVTLACIARGKKSPSSAIRKRAVFADNARKWKHSDGGPLISQGGIWSNGVTTINNGGTHEHNPFEGVQIGTDSEGVPNLVEEGEVIWNDYVFSNRLKPLKKDKKLMKIKGKDATYADAAKVLQKESNERPNDPISKRGLDAMMSRLAISQEALKYKRTSGKLKKQQNIPTYISNNQFSFGGDMDDDVIGGPYSSGLYMDDTGEDTSGGVYTTMNDYLTEPIGLTANNVSASPKNRNRNKFRFDTSYLRYAPIIGSALAVGKDLVSRPDYTGSDTLLEASRNAGQFTPISYTPVHNYLDYNPLDRDRLINKIHSQAAAGRRALLASTANTSAGMAGLLQLDFNTQNAIGDAGIKGDEYNQAQRERVESFNRGTNAMNAEMGLKAAMANQEARLKSKTSRLGLLAQSAAMREEINRNRAAGISANLTNLFENIGNVGREEFSRNMITSNPALYYTIDNTGRVSYKKKSKKKSDRRGKDE